jgi:hypothetical protein
VQAVDSLEALTFGELRFPIVAPAEFMVYRDEAALAAWQAHGATPENQATMMHVIIASDSATIVVDDDGSDLATIARELLESVPRNRIILQAA